MGLSSSKPQKVSVKKSRKVSKVSKSKKVSDKKSRKVSKSKSRKNYRFSALNARAS